MVFKKNLISSSFKMLTWALYVLHDIIHKLFFIQKYLLSVLHALDTHARRRPPTTPARALSTTKKQSKGPDDDSHGCSSATAEYIENFVFHVS